MFQLPTMPPRIGALPRDSRGYPVPWFVQWFDAGQPSHTGTGIPDFRIVNTSKFIQAVKRRLCWVCGGSLGRHQIFVIGPMCVINRVTSEPPNHRECAEFAAKACPFLTQPRMKRNPKALPVSSAVDPAGIHLDRNPGAMCLYETKHFRPFKPEGDDGYLFRLGEPDRVDWYARGRIATRDEVSESIRTGFPTLEHLAKEDGAEALMELYMQRDRAMALLPA